MPFNRFTPLPTALRFELCGGKQKGHANHTKRRRGWSAEEVRDTHDFSVALVALFEPLDFLFAQRSISQDEFVPSFRSKTKRDDAGSLHVGWSRNVRVGPALHYDAHEHSDGTDNYCFEFRTHHQGGGKV